MDDHQGRRALPIDGVRLIAEPVKMVPKYCTSVLFSKLQNEQLIMTFVFGEKRADVEDDPVLIERIVIHREHAEKMVQALNQLLQNGL